MASMQNVGYSDTFLHELIEETGEKNKKRILFPFTRYDNILNRPLVLDKGEGIENSNNPDFLLVTTETEEVDDAVIYDLYKQEW